MKIAAYLRKSVKGDDSSISIEAQLEIIKNYFNKENCEFTVYEDNGFSGGNINRPAFTKMMQERNNYNVIACYKLDRMARNTLDFLTTFEMLKKEGIDLVCVQDNYDPRTPSGKMMMTLLASLAEMERENIRRRAIDGMYSLAKQGRWSGGTPPLGCKVVTLADGKYLEIEDTETINYMFNQFHKGKSIRKLSREIGLTERCISYALKTPVYIASDLASNRYLESIGYTVIGEPNGNGYMTYIHNKNNNSKTIKLAVVSKHKGIVPSNIWIDVKEKLNLKNLHKYPRISNKSWLAQKVICNTCNSTMVISLGNKRVDGTRPLYFKCKQNCLPLIRVDKAESKILESLKSISIKDLKSNKRNFDTEVNIVSNLQKKIKEKENLLKGLIDKISMVSESLASTMITRAESLNNEILILNNELTQHQLILNSKSSNKNLLKDKEKAKQFFIENFYDITIEEKQNLINLIIDNCTWDGENIFIN
ncbi:recombinase family protein [Clostridium sp.]|uniref:recombinase family protein n=1 Tax=Clostridium sp. TaxID=1506 RepID=UPI001D56A3DF|nr:recombinase family protein [Clostridium sp.]MBS5306444.1 recombinase family protein [Clostridium sp.]